MQDLGLTLAYDADEASAVPRNRVFDVTQDGGLERARWTVGDGTSFKNSSERWPYFDDWVNLELLSRDGGEPFDGFTAVNRQERYTSGGDDILLASGFQARMIEAEARLAAGDLVGATALINTALTGDNPWGLELPPVDPETVTEARQDLARARALGLWLTGTRQAILRRLVETWELDLYPDGTRGTDISLPPGDGSITCP